MQYHLLWNLYLVSGGILFPFQCAYTGNTLYLFEQISYSIVFLFLFFPLLDCELLERKDCILLILVCKEYVLNLSNEWINTEKYMIFKKCFLSGKISKTQIDTLIQWTVIYPKCSFNHQHSTIFVFSIPFLIEYLKANLIHIFIYKSVDTSNR